VIVTADFRVKKLAKQVFPYMFGQYTTKSATVVSGNAASAGADRRLAVL
jgi:hypothetical protein